MIETGQRKGGGAMDAMERRCQIIEILCDAKMRIKMRDLASRFNVSIRTDVDVLSLTYPIQTTRGRYNGGIGFIDGYRPAIWPSSSVG